MCLYSSFDTLPCAHTWENGHVLIDLESYTLLLTQDSVMTKIPTCTQQETAQLYSYSWQYSHTSSVVHILENFLVLVTVDLYFSLILKAKHCSWCKILRLSKMGILTCTNNLGHNTSTNDIVLTSLVVYKNGGTQSMKRITFKKTTLLVSIKDFDNIFGHLVVV